jgi:hypothetical protein
MAQNLVTTVIVVLLTDLKHFEMAATSTGDDRFIHWLFNDADSERGY